FKSLCHHVRYIAHNRRWHLSACWCVCYIMPHERRTGRETRMVVLHDAEDMVDPASLVVLDRAMDDAEFVQLPVLPELQKTSRWIGNHYCDEFAEDHGKTMVVRQALAAAVPSAGVGCAVARRVLRAMVADGHGPF